MLSNKDEYILNVVRPARDAVAQIAISIAIASAKDNLSLEKIEQKVKYSAYTAAYSIAKNVAYIRTAYDTAFWLTSKRPNVGRIAYNAAINAAKVTHDPNYNDPEVQNKIAAAIMGELIAAAKQEDPMDSALEAVSYPKDPFCATQAIAREAAQKVFEEEDDVNRAVVTMFEVAKIYYDVAIEKGVGESFEDEDYKNIFIRSIVSEQATKFSNELATLGNHKEQERIELNSFCHSIIVNQLVLTADTICRESSSYANSGLQKKEGGLFNLLSIVYWTFTTTFSENAATKKLVKSEQSKSVQEAENQIAKQINYLSLKVEELAPPRQIQEAYRILDEIGSMQPVSDQGYPLVRKFIERYLNSKPEHFIEKVKNTPVREMVYIMVMNTAADFVESGEYHIYRGIVNPIGPGSDLVRIFNWSQDEMLKLGMTDEKTVEISKESFTRNLQTVG